jgi:hypothetical protein
MKEITLEDIVSAIKSGDKSHINEASLGRVYQHITRNASNSFAILTAFRGGFSKRENLQRNKQLQSDVRSLGNGFFKVKGYWVECQDSNFEYANCPDDMKIPVIEDSLFVPDISLKDAVRLCKKYDQDAIVFMGKETGNKVELISKSGTSIMKLGAFNPSKIAQAYTRIKGTTFTFEGFQYQPSGQMENLIFEVLLNEI